MSPGKAIVEIDVQISYTIMFWYCHTINLDGQTISRFSV